MGTLTDSMVGAAGEAGAGLLSGSPRPAPARIGKYEIESEIGQGALVKAFRAFDRDTGRPVTLKVLTEVADRGLVERFRREAAAVSRLHHRSIIGIYELGEHVGLPFVAQQHLGDDNLRGAIRNQTSLTLLQKMLILWGVAEGLQTAHLAGLTQVGLRPGGIALGRDGSVTIQDFGIVRLLGGPQHAEAGYLAPEERDPDFPPDELCDVFAYGTIYYEFLTGVHPFQASDHDAASRQPPPLRSLLPECPEPLAQLLHRALAWERELRYPSVEDLQCDAEPVLRALKRAHAAELVAAARLQLDVLQFDAALAMVREILELDPDNHEAQELRAALRGQVQRRTVASRLEALCQKSDQEAAARNFDRAVEILESALRLDPADPEITSHLERMRSRQVGWQLATCLLADARNLLGRQSLTEAQAKVAEALEYDPENPEARDLEKVIRQALQRRGVEARIEQELVKAKSSLLLQSFEEAIAILAALRAECPGSSVIEHWLEHAQTQQAESGRQTRLQAGLSEARARLSEQRFGAAVSLLEALGAEYPDEEEIRDLSRRAGAARDRAWSVAQVMSQCEELRRQEQFEKALAALEAGLTAYPAEPSLESLRREIRQQWQDSKSSAAARAALEEAHWLIGQDRPDLAVPLLRAKAAEYPDRTELLAELAGAERIFSEWEKRRLIKDALNRVAALEQRRQWEAALTVLDEALEAYPASADLLDRVAHFRGRLREQERRNKLARRLDAIGQKIASQAWSEALALLGAAQAEFPQEPELQAPYAAAVAGLKRSECESITAGVRHALADGELDQAEEILRQGLERHPDEPALQELHQELRAKRAYREEWRTAQVLFGRGQYQEAEGILVRLLSQAPEDADAQAMLEAVRGVRADSEEENFYARGREKAIRLIQERQFQPAADLLRNLLSLFPGDPILQRDLHTALAGQGAGGPQPAVVAVEEAAPPATDLPAVKPATPHSTVAPRPRLALRLRKLVTAPVRRLLLALPLVVLVAAGATLWRSKPKEAAPKAPRAAVSPAIPVPVKISDPAPSADPPAPVSPVFSASRSQARPAVRPARSSAPPLPAASAAVPDPGPATPSAEGNASAPTAPAGVGGNFQQPKLLQGRMPVTPQQSGYRGMSGAVVLEALVDKTGVVTRATVQSGLPLLAEIARDEVLKWRYQPGRLNGEPVETKVTIRIVFQPAPRAK